jgi:hypothetical protein
MTWARPWDSSRGVLAIRVAMTVSVARDPCYEAERVVLEP